jgi:hypothetical protein
LFTFNLPVTVGPVKSEGDRIKFQTGQFVKVLKINSSAVYLQSFKHIPIFIMKGWKLLGIAKKKDDK